MAKFNYKFESVKNVKIALEKKTQKELTLIEMEMVKREDEIKELVEEKTSHKKEMMSRKTMKVAELKFYADFEKVIDEKIEAKKSEIKKLEVERNKKFEELTEKTRETKMFEKLEEKHKLEFKREQDKLEQIEIDDIATKKFIRNS